MPAYPYVPFTYVGTANEVTTTRLNTSELGIRDMSQQPAVRVTHSTTQSATTGVPLVLAFNTERYDQAGGSASTMHDTVTNNSRLTAVYAGIYSIAAHGEWTASIAGSSSAAAIRLNGATTIARQLTGSVDLRSWSLETKYLLAVNDYVEVLVTQNSGSSATVAQAGNYTPEFMMVRVG